MSHKQEWFIQISHLQIHQILLLADRVHRNIECNINLMGGYNVTNWATNVSTNWTNLAVNKLSSNFTLVLILQ